MRSDWLLFCCWFCSYSVTTDRGDRGRAESGSGAPKADQEEEGVLRFGILGRLPGLWHGTVSTTTPAGSFDNWYVYFRPVSAGQVSQYSTLDARTINYISFFIVRHEGRLKVALRTEGVFDGKGCVTYEVVDTVRESEGYYRFADFPAGDDRAYTEFTFKDDEFLMEVYTNRFNRVSPLELHSRWRARLGDRNAAAEAVSGFPVSPAGHGPGLHLSVQAQIREHLSPVTGYCL